MGNRKRYRYIRAYMDSLDEPIHHFRLVSGKILHTGGSTCSEAMRIEIPADMELTKCTCDLYATTEDERSIRELNPVPVVYIDGRWRKMPELIKVSTKEWYITLQSKGLHLTVANGYLSHSKWQKYREGLQKRAEREYSLSDLRK